MSIFFFEIVQHWMNHQSCHLAVCVVLPQTPGIFKDLKVDEESQRDDEWVIPFPRTSTSCGNHVLLLSRTSRCLGILVGKTWNGATLIWSPAIATWFRAVFFSWNFLPQFLDLVIFAHWGLYIPYQWLGKPNLKGLWGCRFGNFQQLISWSYLRYHQVTAHPGRSINVHVWHGTQSDPRKGRWISFSRLDGLFSQVFSRCSFQGAFGKNPSGWSTSNKCFSKSMKVLASCQVWCCQLQGSKGVFLKAGGVGWLGKTFDVLVVHVEQFVTI